MTLDQQPILTASLLLAAIGYVFRLYIATVKARTQDLLRQIKNSEARYKNLDEHYRKLLEFTASRITPKDQKAYAEFVAASSNESDTTELTQ